MVGAGIHFKMYRRGAGPPAPSGPAAGQVSDLWFALAQRSWSSLVFVPADEGLSATDVASAFAEFGSRLRDTPVTAILADSMDFESARILSDLELRANEELAAQSARVTVETRVAEPPRFEEEFIEVPAANGGAAASPVWAIQRSPADETAVKSGAVVVAIQPVVVEPLGVAIAQAASAVVLCVALGRTRLASARRTVELIGAERIAGAYVLR
jgi:hypothetical protein